MSSTVGERVRTGVAGPLVGPGGPGVDQRTETTVLVVADYQLSEELLTAALGSVSGIRCVGSASSVSEGVRLVKLLRPSVVVLDIQVPGRSALVAARRLGRANRRTAVAVVTSQHGEGALTVQGGSAGLDPHASFAELVDLLKSVQPSESGPSEVGPQRELTSRELEVLRHINQGLQAKQIARVMGISVYTCRGYIKAAYAKLEVGSQIAAVNRCRQLQLLDV